METTALDALIDVDTIYYEQAAADLARGRQILDRFPDAERIEVPSHWNIPGLHGNEGNAQRWVRVKRGTLVVGTLKSPRVRPNGRSADFIAPSLSNGCAMACAYCYVPRRKGYANPITVFANAERILATYERHIIRQGRKSVPNQCDPERWVYDIGESSDCSVDALISDNVRDALETTKRHPTAMLSFATKHVNRDLLDWDPQGAGRIRFSIMPEPTSRLVDVRTSPVAERIAAIDDFVAAGWEVHLNLSPVIVGEGWLELWDDLLTRVADSVGPAARAQLKAEVIFLTHNADLHEVNLRWHPKAEDVLWRPDLQQAKRSQNGMWNVRYHPARKRRYVDDLLDVLARRLPECGVRYAF